MRNSTLFLKIFLGLILIATIFNTIVAIIYLRDRSEIKRQFSSIRNLFILPSVDTIESTSTLPLTEYVDEISLATQLFNNSLARLDSIKAANTNLRSNSSPLQEAIDLKKKEIKEILNIRHATDQMVNTARKMISELDKMISKLEENIMLNY